jgi:hypothetical protein
MDIRTPELDEMFKNSLLELKKSQNNLNNLRTRVDTHTNNIAQLEAELSGIKGNSIPSDIKRANIMVQIDKLKEEENKNSRDLLEKHYAFLKNRLEFQMSLEHISAIYTSKGHQKDVIYFDIVTSKGKVIKLTASKKIYDFEMSGEKEQKIQKYQEWRPRISLGEILEEQENKVNIKIRGGWGNQLIYDSSTGFTKETVAEREESIYTTYIKYLEEEYENKKKERNWRNITGNQKKAPFIIPFKKEWMRKKFILWRMNLTLDDDKFMYLANELEGMLELNQQEG